MSPLDKTVLVVEDNDLNMRLFHDVLEAGGYNVLQATDGMEGWRMPEAYLRFLDSVKNAEWRSPKNDANPKNGRLRRSVAR